MPEVFPYQHSELVFGLVAPLGTDLQAVEHRLQKKLKAFGYRTNSLRLSSFLKHIAPASLGVKLRFDPEYERINSHMDAGDALRAKTGLDDALALHAVYEIHGSRERGEPHKNTIHVLNSLKHPDEVRALRRVYGPGFFLLGVYASEEDRERHLHKDLGIPVEKARALIRRDSDESLSFGQHTADTFQLADVFVRAGDAGEEQLFRFIDLLFGNPFITPTFDENAMFLAYAASLRSGDLSRQVGAAVSSSRREIVATGANDVPKFGGGQYWDGEENDDRDWRRGFDSNKKEIRDILGDTIKRLGLGGDPRFAGNKAEELVRGGRLFDLTEFGRAVHAEMAALLACARRAVSPIDGTMYVTTFPCHNCAKHIIAAGIRRLFYVEPYAKSRAAELHGDAITLDDDAPDSGADAKLKFLPFIGITARRYVDLFSMRLSAGAPVVRQRNGMAVDWQPSGAQPRLGMSPVSYIEREKIFATQLLRVASKSNQRKKGGRGGREKSQ